MSLFNEWSEKLEDQKSFSSLEMAEMYCTARVNGTFSVLLCNLFRFRKEAVPALRLEFRAFAQ